MSQSITITRTVTTTNQSTVILNIRYLRTVPGILKLLEIILGTICLILLLKFHGEFHSLIVFPIINDIPALLFTTTFLIGSACLLLACVVSFSTGVLIERTVYVNTPFFNTIASNYPEINFPFLLPFQIIGIPVSRFRCYSANSWICIIIC